MTEPAPLEGVAVLDLTALAPGPFATMLLGDLGADVITIEAPAARRKGAGVTDVPLHGGRASRERQLNPLYRSRRSIVVDLKHPEGAAIVGRLAERSDVFIEGFRPGVADRLGVGYAALSTRNQRLVYCSLTGYGQDGPLAQKPGHDLNYLAYAGLLAITARDGSRPGIPANVVADFAAGGLVAAFGILAALHARERSGRGSYVDVSMFDGVLSMLAVAEAWRRGGAPDPSYGRGLVTGGAPFYDCYATADGKYMAVGCIEPKFFKALCDALGLPDLAPLQFQPERWDELRAAFTAAFASATRDEWETRFEGVDTAVSPVLALSEAFERRGTTDVVVPRFRDAQPVRHQYAPRAGSHTDEVLSEAGYTSEDVAALRDVGAVA